MPANLGGWTGLLLVLIVLLLFAAPKLPSIAKSVAQSMNVFKREMKNNDGATNDSDTNATATDSAPANADENTPKN